jgi:hypothetical protein
MAEAEAGGGEGGAYAPTHFGRIEDAALLLADPDFQTLRHPWTLLIITLNDKKI